MRVVRFPDVAIVWVDGVLFVGRGDGVVKREAAVRGTIVVEQSCREMDMAMYLGGERSDVEQVLYAKGIFIRATVWIIGQIVFQFRFPNGADGCPVTDIARERVEEGAGGDLFRAQSGCK